jgi:histidyl-tRNA synthetase
MVNLSDLVSEVKARIQRKVELDSLAIEAEGLRVVGDSKKEVESNNVVEGVAETEKPAEETPLSQEAIGAVPAS